MDLKKKLKKIALSEPCLSEPIETIDDNDQKVAWKKFRKEILAVNEIAKAVDLMDRNRSAASRSNNAV
jgi:hypothetical protein